MNENEPGIYLLFEKLFDETAKKQEESYLQVHWSDWGLDL